ncbi:Hypothetical protein CINCED_3A021210 [Cinara cedri]|uniref:Uncharacterized protein n=1 Tax=Cinara cedri TaxID=506608 RepID=A0A5E4M9V1_9HEMI|nr:Hypothetical protein CINCED_3A021210 [Cinara cedri]
MSLTSSIVSQDIMKTLEVIADIFQEENIKICVKESGKGALIAGISSFIGGILGGKSGFLTGGIVGTIAAYSMSPDYKSFIEIIHDLDYEKQKKLFDAIKNSISSVDITDVVKFSIALATSQSLKEIVIKEAIKFVSNELNMQITRG